MKIKRKILGLALALSLGVPTFASVSVEDTFTFSNITDTVAVLQNTINNGLNYYFIASDSTVRACGPTVIGIDATIVNTNNSWIALSKNEFGTPLDNIVKINGSIADYITMLDVNGDVWVTSASSPLPKKINSSGIKFTDITSLYTKNGYVLSSLMVAESGELYKYDSIGVSKIGNFNDIESVMNFCASNSDIIAWVKHKNGDVSFVSNSGVVQERRLQDVIDVYSCADGVYVRFVSGKVMKYFYTSNTLKTVAIPDGEKFSNIIGWCGIVADDYIYLITDKSRYIMRDETLVKIDIATQNNSLPVLLNRNIGMCDDGKIYKCVMGTGLNRVFNPMPEIDSWTNDNPIVMNTDLAHFNIDANTVEKRGKTYEFSFSLVTKKAPKAFNIYYCKDSKTMDRVSWNVIEENVAISRLNPEPYLTGYVDASGVNVDGFTYTYDWIMGDENLLGIHLIVEPVY